MIYESVDETAPIRQGDIFRSIPYVRFEPGNLAVLRPTGRPVYGGDWLQEAAAGSIRVLVDITSVDGIVVTQDCDAARDDYIAFFQIDDFLKVTGKTEPKSAKGWVSVLTKHARTEQKWFYLPPDENYGFKDRKAANFSIIVPVPLPYVIENIKKMRVGRLNEVSYEHFREKVSQYFRRYPYDEWYPLNKEEFEAYRAESGGSASKPFTWQL